MKEFLKYLGVFILLIGVLILAIPALQGTVNNTLLLTGLIVMILGYASYIFINKRVE